ncbi:MAG: hypothetical protein P4L40_13855 [Terracidiphilus sp.]|nr:hypothetical protein [Terracidiphilus sp.]
MRLTRKTWQRARMALGYCLLAMAMAWIALAQGVSTTTVQGTVYLANGKQGAGTLQVSWPAFTTSNGLAVAAGHLTATIGADGFVSVNLTPNLGATPAGLFYTAVYHMSDGTTSTEYWVVPSAAQATIASVRAQVMPAAQAVQAASKAYVDQAILSLASGSLTPVGGTLTGPLYLNGDPTQALQVADKHYVDATFAQAMPLAGGAATGPLTATQLGAAWQVDQFAGADFGAKLQACILGLSSTYGGTCDARNFTGTLAMASNVTIATANTTVLLPCATIATAKQIVVTAGTRNVSLRGCSLRGASTASGSAGGTVFLYSGAAAAMQVGDATYAVDTQGFHLDNAVINTTGATAATATALAVYRTQELDLQGLYLLGNANQTGMTLDGTGNYTGGTFYDIAANGFQAAINGIGHQTANAATTDWLNASTFVRVHVNCPTSGGLPIAGTVGINLTQGDGNTFTGGDVEGCATALHLGANAQNNTIVGLRNENSTNQIVADAGSAYNNWITGGTMFTGKLVDNGTRNSFLDTFHRSFNGINGDWYGSQQDATVTNHFRLGTGLGNERGLLNRYQTDYGYRWTMGLTDATAGAQFYQVQDELNNVSRLSIGQYLTAAANTVTNVALNSSGCYSSNVAPALTFSGGGGSGAAGTANMVVSQCSGGYTVGSVTMTSNGAGYTSQPTIAWSGSNQIAAPSAVAEIATAGSTNNQTVINAAGTGAVVLNGSNNSGTGGVVIGSGGASETTVATISSAGNANFVGTLQVGGTSTFVGSTTVRNQADAEIDAILQAGLTAEQKESFVYRDYTGASQWYMVKDQYNNWALNSAKSGINAFKAYQSTGSGDTYVNASLPAGVVRMNYEPNSGTGVKIYGGNSSTLYAAFTGATAIQFPGLAAASGHNCLQIDNSGYISNTGSACGSGGGLSGTVSGGSTGQIAYYSANGTTLNGLSTVPVSAGGTGASTAAGALAALGGASLATSTAQSFSGAIAAPAIAANVNAQINVMAPPYNAKGDCTTDDSAAITAALRAADAYAIGYINPAEVFFPTPPGGCYYAGSTIAWYGEPLRGVAPGNGGSSFGRGGSVIKGAPGLDILHVPDPTSNNYVWYQNWAIHDLSFIVDASVAGNYPHRWPGRWVTDASMTAGSATFKSPNSLIACGDVGQAILVKGAGASGADLSTTIASVTPCWATTQVPTSSWQTITLAAAASTTVSSASAYIAAANNSVTDKVGACAIAWDDLDGNPANWAHSNNNMGNAYDVLHDVSVVSTTARQNGTCALYTQGVWGFYGLDAQNITIAATDYGIVQGTSELNPYYQSSSNDFQKWDHILFTNMNRPWISYNGGLNSLTNVEITAQYGPQILGEANRWSDAVSGWHISIPEFENNTGASTIGLRVIGTNHIIDQGGPANSSAAYFDTTNTQCNSCDLSGTVYIGGNLNRFNNTGGSASNIVDQGRGNVVVGGYSGNTHYGIPYQYEIAMNTFKGDGVANRLTPDMIQKGNAGNYPSLNDLWFWPQDAIFNSYGSPVYGTQIQADSTSPTGYEFLMNGNQFGNWSHFDEGPWSTSFGTLTVGTHFPATAATVYVMAKCPSGTTSFTPAMTTSGGGSWNAGAQTCSTSWQTYSFRATGLSAYAGNTAIFGGSGNFYAAWWAIRPDAADYNGYQPAHGGANADITSLTGLTTPLSTTQGGTGAGALTGYRYANGSGADTASTAIPKAAIGGQAGAGAGLVTGPTTSVSGDVVSYTGTAGQVQDSGVALSSLASLASPTFTGNTITFANAAATEQDLVIKPGSSADQIGAYALANYSGTTQWKLRKDASNYLRLTDAVNSLDRMILYQNGQTILNAGAGSNAVVINGTTNSGAGGLLVQSGGASPATVLTVTASGNTTATGFVVGKSYAGSGAMTLASGTAAGTSPTIACAVSHVCDGVSGDVTLTTGTSPTTGTLATLTFPSTHTNYANCIVKVLSSTAQLTTVTWSETAAAVTLTANSALTASTAYQVRYWCGGN